MKKVKPFEFLCLTWILIGLLNSCGVDSFKSESESESINNEPEPELTQVDVYKCDPDSFNSESEVEDFFYDFGYEVYLNITFKNSFNHSKNRCEIQTVNIQFRSESESQENSTSTSLAENENEIIKAKVAFWKHGFFEYPPHFFINPENYCVKTLSQGVLTVEICKSASTSTSNSDSTPTYFPPTLQKCCDTQQSLTIDESQKTPCHSTLTPPWKPKFMEGLNLYPNYHSKLPCANVSRILPRQLATKIQRGRNSKIVFKDIRVLENGRVETRETGNHNWKKLEQNTYCIDRFEDELPGDEITEEIKADHFMVFHCPPNNSASAKTKDTVHTVACFISSFVLLIIVIVHLLIWNQQNIHGWTKCAYSLALFLWLFCTGVRLVYEKDDGFCLFIAVSTHFSHILLYSWMLVMNFDLWSTISSMTAVSHRSAEKRRFLWFCCFALIIPTIVVSVSLIIENQFGLFDDRVIRPQYGRERCYLDRTAVNVYVMYPALILFLSNFIFIFLTLKIILDLKKGRKRLQGEDSKITSAQKNNNAEINLCLKLFIIMGISWIFDIISGLLDADAGEVSWYWMITDIYNIAQPFFLFWLFVYKKLIRDQLSDKYSFFKVGFKWMDVHLPRFSSASKTAAGSSQSESQSQNQSQGQATKLTVFSSQDDNLD